MPGLQARDARGAGGLGRQRQLAVHARDAQRRRAHRVLAHAGLHHVLRQGGELVVRRRRRRRRWRTGGRRAAAASEVFCMNWGFRGGEEAATVRAAGREAVACYCRLVKRSGPRRYARPRSRAFVTNASASSAAAGDSWNCACTIAPSIASASARAVRARPGRGLHQAGDGGGHVVLVAARDVEDGGQRRRQLAHAVEERAAAVVGPGEPLGERRRDGARACRRGARARRRTTPSSARGDDRGTRGSGRPCSANCR